MDDGAEDSPSTALSSPGDGTEGMVGCVASNLQPALSVFSNGTGGSGAMSGSSYRDIYNTKYI
jgi:hypothetical protein